MIKLKCAPVLVLTLLSIFSSISCTRMSTLISSPTIEAHVPFPYNTSTLRVTEIARERNFDLHFQWDECDFCSGYEALLRLTTFENETTFTYPLRLGTTSLSVRGINPKTKYHLEIEKKSSVSSDRLVVEGQIHHDNPFPPPVENLYARMVKPNKIEVEWTSREADGFHVSAYPQTAMNMSIVKTYPFKGKQYRQRISVPVAEDNYTVVVTPFYNSTSDIESNMNARSVQVLPWKLPSIRVQTEEDIEGNFRIQWINPSWPKVVFHRIVCTRKSSNQPIETVLDMNIDGRSEFFQMNKIMFSTSSFEDCELITAYSTKPTSRTLIYTRILNVPMPYNPTLPCFSNDTDEQIPYQDEDNLVTAILAPKTKTHKGESASFDVHFLVQRSHNPKLKQTLEYTFCRDDKTCFDWKDGVIPRPDPDDDLPYKYQIHVTNEDLLPWNRYTLAYRIYLRCSDPFTSIVSHTKKLTLPVLSGPVSPITSLNVSQNGSQAEVEWSFNDSFVPDFFLLTRCSRPVHGRDARPACFTEMLPSDMFAYKLSYLNEGCITYVSVRVGKVHRDTNETTLSEPQMRTFLVPTQELSPMTINLDVEEIGNSSYVRVYINATPNAETLLMKEFNVIVCGMLLPIWDDVSIVELSNRTRNCENFSVSTNNATLMLNRRPWSEYNVTVGLCYGELNIQPNANITLPIYKLNPGPLDSLSIPEPNIVQWSYENFWAPSGFFISFCPDNSEKEYCTKIHTDASDRLYHFETDPREHGRLNVSVSAFVRYNGSEYLGPESQIEFV